MKKLIYQSIIFTLLITVCSCNSNNQKTNLEANRDIVKRYHKVWSNGQVTDMFRPNNVSQISSVILLMELNGKPLREQKMKSQVIENLTRTGMKRLLI